MPSVDYEDVINHPLLRRALEELAIDRETYVKAVKDDETLKQACHEANLLNALQELQNAYPALRVDGVTPALLEEAIHHVRTIRVGDIGIAYLREKYPLNVPPEPHPVRITRAG